MEPKVPPWFDPEKHEVDEDTGVIMKRGYNMLRNPDLRKRGQAAVAEKIARVEKETKEKEKKKK